MELFIKIFLACALLLEMASKPHGLILRGVKVCNWGNSFTEERNSFWNSWFFDVLLGDFELRMICYREFSKAFRANNSRITEEYTRPGTLFIGPLANNPVRRHMGKAILDAASRHGRTLKDLLLFHTGNEGFFRSHFVYDASQYSTIEKHTAALADFYLRFKKSYRQFLTPLYTDLHESQQLGWLPLGSLHRRNVPVNFIESSNRLHQITFIGTATTQFRKSSFIKEIEEKLGIPIFGGVNETAKFGEGAKMATDYLNVLSNSKFCLQLIGKSVECHRIYESLENGCIPIIINAFGKGDNFTEEINAGFLPLLDPQMFGLNLSHPVPFPWVQTVDELKDLMYSLSPQGIDIMQRRTIDWFDNLKEAWKQEFRSNVVSLTSSSSSAVADDVDKTNVILAVAFGYEPKQCFPFVSSLRKVFTGQIVIFVKDRTKSAWFLFARRFHLTIVHKDHKEQVRNDGKRIILEMARFQWYNEECQRKSGKSGYCIAADIRDTFFLSNPFNRIPKGGYDLVLGEEGTNIGNSKFMSFWIHSCAKIDGGNFPSIKHKMTLNGGIIVGNRDGFAAIANAFKRYACNDQGALNYLYYNQERHMKESNNNDKSSATATATLRKVLVQPLGEGLMYSGGSSWWIGGRNGHPLEMRKNVNISASTDPQELEELFSCRGRNCLRMHIDIDKDQHDVDLPAIVHQYDRHPKLAQFVHLKTRAYMTAHRRRAKKKKIGGL
jgi:hypothetical protein